MEPESEADIMEPGLAVENVEPEVISASGEVDVAREYEKLKLNLWKEYEHNRDGYTNAKTEFIKKHTKQAKSLYKNRY